MTAYEKFQSVVAEVKAKAKAEMEKLPDAELVRLSSLYEDYLAKWKELTKK